MIEARKNVGIAEDEEELCWEGGQKLERLCCEMKYKL
jgi:hypothetical protein